MTTVKQEKTLLDEFAMAVLTGLTSELIYGEAINFTDISSIAYDIAACMMKERQKYDN
jgi:hypothetical protein